MIDETKVTTEESVAIYNATNDIFLGLLKEIRELSKKKPDAIMSAGKVGIINRVLEDLKLVLDKEPEGKFLDILDDENLPQTSDAVLIMCQYETVLKAYKNKYYQRYKTGTYDSESAWVTPEFLKDYEEYNEYE
jgi:hypothetical protein